MLFPEILKDRFRGGKLYFYLKLLPKWINPSNKKFEKIKSIRKMAYRFNIKTFIETGTNFGETLFHTYHDFESIYSIELSRKLYIYALKRFKNYDKIKLIYGDSAKELVRLVPNIKELALFFIDAHYDGPISGKLEEKGDFDPPVLMEIDAILKSDFDHIILIDDARNFGKIHNYPSLEVLSDFVKKYKKNYYLYVENDMILCIPEK